MARPRNKINVTWLGEDSLHPDNYGPRANVWNGVEFVKGEAVGISDPQMIAKAKANPFYSVEGHVEEDE